VKLRLFGKSLQAKERKTPRKILRSNFKKYVLNKIHKNKNI
jgi:hypothetical protein